MSAVFTLSKTMGEVAGWAEQAWKTVGPGAWSRRTI